MLLGGPVALLLASLLGYAVSALSLRSVENYAAASALSVTQPGDRLAVPAANDELRSLAVTLNGMLEAAFERGSAALRPMPAMRAAHATLSAQGRARAGVDHQELSGRATGSRGVGRCRGRPGDQTGPGPACTRTGRPRNPPAQADRRLRGGRVRTSRARLRCPVLAPSSADR